MKVKITLCYDGSDFQGSQIQPYEKTVQGALQEALAKLNITDKMELSGRTDKGVHAFKQVVSLQIPSFWNDTQKLHIHLQNLLPQTILIRRIKSVDEKFHARFSAKRREYRYIFTNKKLNPFQSRFISSFPHIDIDQIESISKLFCGTHDFAYFSKTGSEPKSTIRTIYKIDLYQYKGYFILRFCGNSFLRSQIRMMVDFIMKVSQGVFTKEQLLLQLQAKEKVSSQLADAHGLYLSKITY